jgi:VCBS repeat-containing protein
VTGGLVLTQGSEDKQVILTQQDLLAHASDSDRNDQGWLKATHLTADHGTISTNADGSFTFTPEKDYNGVVHFNYDVMDRHGGTTHTDATINLVAVNDASVLANALSSNEVIEDHLRGSSSHTLTSYWKNLDITDTDGQADAEIVKIEVNGVEHSVPANFAMTLQGAHGSFVTTHGFDGHNKWRYIADNNHPEIQQLKDGQSLTDHMTLITADGTRIPITATIKGTEDSVIIDTPDSLTASIGTAIEDQKTTLSGTLQAHDVDKDDSVHFQTQNLTGNFGSFSVAKDGTWHYQLDPAKAQHLTAGQNRTEGFDIVAISSDGSTATKHIQINVQGSNDSAIIAGVDTGSVTENSAGKDMSPDYAQPGMAQLSRNPLYVSGALTISDLDTGEAAFNTHGVGFTYSGKFGDLLLQENGQWTYYADAGGVRIKGGYASNRGSTIDQLGEGQTLTDTITVYSKDGTSHDIVITIHGSNDRPYCSSEVVLANGSEDTRQTLTTAQLLSNTVDVDKNDAGLLSIENLHADHGSILINGDGTFTFTPEKDYNGQVHFTYDVTDRHGGVTATSATMNLAPVADAASFKGGDSGSITEDHTHSGVHVVQGNLLVIDPDAGQDSFTTQIDCLSDPFNSNGNGLSISATGGWVYEAVDSTTAMQSLAEGQTVQVQYRVHTAGGETHIISIDVHGTNDAPILIANVFGHTDGGSNPIVGTEDQAIDLPLSKFLGLVRDQDQGAVLHLEDISVDHGHVSISSDGQTIHYTPELNYNGEVIFQYNATDEHGAKVHTGLIMPITAVNDLPTLSITQTNHTQGTLVETDVDTADTHQFSVINGSGQFGDLKVDPHSGEYVYSQRHSVTGMHYDKATATYSGTDVFEVQVSDNHGGVTNKFVRFDANATISAPIGASQQPVIHTSMPHPPTVSDLAPSVAPTTTTTSNGVSLDLLGNSDSGRSNSDDLTNNVTPTVAGQTDIPFSQVNIYDGNKSIATVLSDAKGHYQVTLPVMSEAEHHLSAIAVAPSSTHPVSSSTLSVTIDQSAHIKLNLIAGDNIIDATEQHQTIDITGTVTGVEDGQTVTVSIGQHDYQATVSKGAWSIPLTASEVQTLPGGTLDVRASVQDIAGNLVQTHSPLFVSDHNNPIPLMSFKAPPTPTGSGSIGSHISGDLVAPPLLMQLNPHLSSGGWAISDGHGHTSTQLKGQYGTLTIDPDTGHLDYIYNQAPTPGAKAHGGTHVAGQTVSEEHHDTFQVLYHDLHSSNVDVIVNVDVTYVHGHSGHNQISTHMVGMNIVPDTSSPAPGLVSSDEAEQVLNIEALDFDSITLEDLGSVTHDVHQGAQDYLHQLGLQPAEHINDNDHNLPSDMDLILAQSDNLSNGMTSQEVDEVGNIIAETHDDSSEDKHQPQEQVEDHPIDPNDFMNHQ